VLRRGVGAFGDAFWHGGYFSTVLGAELGAVAAMLGIPALQAAGIPGAIVNSLWKPQATVYLPFLEDNGMWLGIWLGVTVGVFLILRMFKVADGIWTTFLLAILAFFLASQQPALTELKASDANVFNSIGRAVVQQVLLIAVLARGATRLARNRRL
jgi:hypothetical protein